MFDSVQPRGLWPTRLLCPWDSLGKNIGVGSHSLLQGIFLTQGLNPGLSHCRQILYSLSHQGLQNGGNGASHSWKTCCTLWHLGSFPACLAQLWFSVLSKPTANKAWLSSFHLPTLVRSLPSSSLLHLSSKLPARGFSQAVPGPDRKGTQ